jgi:hypothetical protein
MFMHMPKKIGIPVMIAVALAVGAYYVWVIRPVVVDDWTIYQGSARRVTEGGGEPGVEIAYTVRRPERPLFRRSLPALTGSILPDNVTACYGPYEMTFAYRSERTATFRVVQKARLRCLWETRVTLERTGDWRTVTLGRALFKKVSEDDQTRDDLAGLRGLFDFFDDSEPGVSGPRFSNRISFRDVKIEPYEPEPDR